MKQEARYALGSATALVMLIGVIFVVHLVTGPPSGGWTPRKVIVPKGSVTGEAIRLLAENGVLRHPTAFRALVFLTRSGRKLQFGEYTFPLPPSTLGVWRKLVAGDVTKYSVTIPEGSNIFDIARLVAERELCSEEEFLAAAGSREELERLGIHAPSAEGHLFPETYQLVKLQTATEILETLFREFQRRFTPEMQERARRQGFSVTQLLTIASIIEKETGVREEKPLVSSIIRNRIAKGMPLQMDPTVIYGFRLFGKEITKKALQTHSPYNTYTRPGLPPGPIANPGLDAIEAALSPAKTDYLYFVSTNDGAHVFSKTLQEHNRAVAQYRAKRAEAERASESEEYD